jgi:HEAT repeat protein
MLTDDIQHLIAQLGSSDDLERRAAARLVNIGIEAVVPLLEKIREAAPNQILLIAHTVSRVRAAEALSVLDRFARDSDHRVAPAAIDAIGFSHSDGAVHVLGDLLGATSPYRDRVVRALGELGDPRGLEFLTTEATRIVAEPQDRSALEAAIQQARESEDPSILRYYIAIGVALAKLGDHALAHPIGVLSAYDRATQEDPESHIIRLEATHGLRILVGHEQFSRLVDALHDSSEEVRESAMRAMLLLGAKQAVAAWLDLERSGDPLAGLAHSMIHELVGEWPAGTEFADRSDDAQRYAWWDDRESKFLAGTTYRFGRLAWPPDLFSHLDAQDVVEDLHVITGMNFALHVDPSLALDGVPDAVRWTAAAWWDANGSRFDHGRLYKYGHCMALSQVFDS